MATTTFTNNTASPIGLWDTDSVHYVAGAMGGVATLDPSMRSQETIDLYAASGAGENGTATKPVNTTAPVGSGDAEIDAVLSVSNGTWTGYPLPEFTYAWQRSANGTTGWSAISGEADPTYTLAAADDTAYVRCVVKATNAGGNTSANSNVIGPVAAAEE